LKVGSAGALGICRIVPVSDVSAFVDEVANELVRGRSDVTVVLELFDRRYRDVRGEGDPYSSEDPGFKSPG